MSDGTQRSLARVSCASATHTLAWAAATTSGRASESRGTVARLIGNDRSVSSSGAVFSFMLRFARSERLVDDCGRPRATVSGAEGGLGEGCAAGPALARFARSSVIVRNALAGGTDDVDRRAIGIADRAWRTAAAAGSGVGPGRALSQTARWRVRPKTAATERRAGHCPAPLDRTPLARRRRGRR